MPSNLPVEPTVVSDGPPCPPTDRLRALLDDALDPAARAAAETHIDGCLPCQDALAALIEGDDVLRTRLVAAADATPEPPGRTAFLERFLAATVPRPAVTTRPDIRGYEMLERIGGGGMGVVYKARDLRLNRVVAVKLLLDPTYASPETRLRFLIEGEAFARLQHPGIVQVFEFGEAEGLPFLAMEYVPGGTLADRLAAGHRFAPADAAALVADLAAAVASAHRAGVIHRDLKPANVLLASATESRTDAAATTVAPHPGIRPKVTDFGLAKLDQSDLTETGAVMGTPAYMAPEQAAGQSRLIGTTTDVWAMGVILYELLAGRRPFGANALHEIVHVEPPAPRSVDRTVPRDLDTICRKCLEKSPDRRYPTADALGDDLRAFLAGRTITARPARWWEVVAKFARRNPIPTAAAAILLAGAVASFVWVNDARLREVAARQAADDREKDATAALTAKDAALQSEARQKRQAVAKEVEASAMLTFFDRRVFAAVRPKGRAGGLGKDVTLRQAIDASLTTLGQDFADQPLVEARLRMTLGVTYRNLGDNRAAAVELRRARAIFAEERVPENRDTLGCASGLALCLVALGEYPEALDLSKVVLDARRRLFGPDDKDTLASMHNLAGCHFAMRNYADAAELQKKTVDARRRVLPKDDPETLNSAAFLNAIYFAQDKRHPEVLKLTEDTIDAQVRVLGKNDPDTLRGKHNLAMICNAQGQRPRAAILLKEVLGGRMDVLPPGHPDTLGTLGLLAVTLSELGRGAEAVSRIDEYVLAVTGRPAPPRAEEAMYLQGLMDLRMKHYRASDDPVGCLETAQKWEQLKLPVPAGLHDFEAACLRAVTAEVYARTGDTKEAMANANRAMRWLDNAVQVGFRNRSALEENPDLTSLRDRPDFQKLVGSLRHVAPLPRPVTK